MKSILFRVADKLGAVGNAERDKLGAGTPPPQSIKVDVGASAAADVDVVLVDIDAFPYALSPQPSPSSFLPYQLSGGGPPTSLRTSPRFSSNACLPAWTASL